MPSGSSRVAVPLLLVQYSISSRPGSGGTLENDPTARMTCSASSSIGLGLAPDVFEGVTSSFPGPVKRAAPRIGTAPPAVSSRTWLESSG